jgi:hypothetical protein
MMIGAGFLAFPSGGRVLEILSAVHTSSSITNTQLRNC